MNDIIWYVILCVVSLPIFAWETIYSLIAKSYYQFRFFTVLTNVLCWIYFVIKLVYVLISKKNQSCLSKKTSESKFEKAMAVFSAVATISITLVGIVFWIMLAPYAPWGLNLGSLYMIFDHLVVPVTKVLDFIFFTPFNYSKSYVYIWSLAYPLVYYIVTMIIGATYDHFYPYWFMDPAKVSYYIIFGIFAGLLVVYVCMTFGFICLGDWIMKRNNRVRTLPKTAINV